MLFPMSALKTNFVALENGVRRPLTELEERELQSARDAFCPDGQSA
jgi:hypothetical protein